MQNIVLVPNVPTRFDHLLQQRVPSIDVGKAAEYGEIKLLSKYDPAGGIGDINAAVDDIVFAVQKLPKDTTPIVVMSGDPILISATVAKLMQTQNKVEVLRWNRKDNSYEKLEIEL